ncbi:DNA-binding protein [Burkholderia pseudomallei]|uniref:DNA-binding protein n=1 Tax=Burkholderia pseudomallei TaxID=28450 RepID=UPI0018C5827A|nr:DNA-binding protein [Burkholderia pseudomallei]MBG1252179.1 helix-turn-helix domain-containing protein [Burkholderia pseudomallei]
MSDQTSPASSPVIGESMIDARQASYSLRLPYYWFSDRTMRAAKRIPHYLLGGLVRFRLSELMTWAENARTQLQEKEVE